MPGMNSHLADPFAAPRRRRSECHLCQSEIGFVLAKMAKSLIAREGPRRCLVGWASVSQPAASGHLGSKHGVETNHKQSSLRMDLPQPYAHAYSSADDRLMSSLPTEIASSRRSLLLRQHLEITPLAVARHSQKAAVLGSIGHAQLTASGNCRKTSQPKYRSLAKSSCAAARTAVARPADQSHCPLATVMLS